MNPEIAKYIIMMQLASPHSIQNAPQSVSDVHWISPSIALIQQNPTITNSIIQQLIFNKVIDKFENDVKQYPHLVEGNYNSAKQYFSKTLELLSPLNPDNIVFSLTTSESLYFRIYKGKKEITLEVFYSKYDADDNIEAVVIVSENDKPVSKDFGILSEIFNNILYSKDSAPKCITPECEYA